MEEYKRIKWHPAFYGGMELELRNYRESLSFESEHELSKEPIRMDLLIIKKHTDIKIENPIAEIYRKYNIVEYKSPDDELNINDLYKVIGYAGLYKGTSTLANRVEADELTISIFRYRYPRELFKELDRLGADISQHTQGVYYINGIINLPLQIIVIKELESKIHTPLTILAKNAREEEVREFLEIARHYKITEDKANADALLQASISANNNLYDRIRRENGMCEALRELMKDEIDKEVKEAIADKDAVIADKDAAIASKDAEIAELKSKLEQLTK